jgi:preprotein translocase SecE subunit
MALELYKPEDATRSRGLLAVMIAALLGYGIYSLYEFLAIGFWQKDLIGGVLGDEFPLSPRVILAGVLFVVLGIATYLVVNNQKIVDFLIETENEMLKVSWSPRHEVISSSVVVVATTVILGIYLWGVDSLLVWFKRGVPWEVLWDRLLGGA